MADATYTDIGLSFKKHPFTKDVIEKYDVYAVKQALTVLFFTNPSEKRFDPDFGIGIRNHLFELITPIGILSLKKKIKHQIDFYEPRVKLEDIQITDNIDTNEIFISVYFYVIGNSTETELLTLSFERIR